MSGIGLQQSILMGKNSNLSSSLREHQNAIEDWKRHCKLLEMDLSKEKKLHKIEMERSNLLKSALTDSRGALEASRGALEASKRLQALTEEQVTMFKTSAHEQRATALEIEDDYHNALRSNIDLTDMLSVIKARHVTYHSYVKSLVRDVTVNNTQAAL